METLSAVISHPQSYLLVVARMSGLLLVAPVVGSPLIPALIRVALVLTLAWALFPIHGLSAPEPSPVPVSLILATAGELAVGVTAGFVANLFFLIFTMAGTMIGNQMGFGIIQLFDPIRQQRSTLVDEVYSLLATVLFLSLNGHHLLIRALDRTYDAVPSGAIVHPEVVALPLWHLTSEMLAAGLQLALPILAALFLTDLALALTSRAVPQINVFFLGLPIKVLVGMMALSLALPATLGFMRDQMDAGTRNMLTVVGGM